jgi:mono/diheme cytochrome c family protein
MLFEKRAQTAVENRSYGTYYLIFSGLLFLGTAWAVWDEVKIRRPWKEYQTTYREMLAAKLDSLRHEAMEGADQDRINTLQEELKQAEAALQSDEYKKALAQKNDLLADLEIATREWRFARSRSDAAYYQYKKSLQDGKESSSHRREIDKHEEDIAARFAEMNALDHKIAAVDEVLNRYQDTIARLQVELAQLFAETNALSLKMQRVRNMPITVRQVMMNDFEFTPFSEIKARIDRCQTCHLGWSEPLMEEAPQPFTLHPLPELLSKHNPESFGCTPCHRGQGPALTAGFAHGDADHYWETPILRGVDVWASCNTCHTEETLLKGAPPFTKAKNLVLETGCFGCHEIKGYTDVPKIGPPLNSLPAKVNVEWLFRWVKNPHDYNPQTRMPNFLFNDEQAEAITAYLMKIGKESNYQFIRARGSHAGGNAAAGKAIFETVGCNACHVVGDNLAMREKRGTSYDIAPELTRVGSKVNPDWLFDWIKNPRHYNAEARMPSLRLSDVEARHIVAYLTTLKDGRRFDQVKINLDDAEKIARGDRLIREYGCAGCHTIKGMESEGKVSVNLSDFGRKKYEQMDYGDTKELPRHSNLDYQENADGSVSVKHTWAGWVYGKLKNSRLYETERIPQKMPVFSFSDEEVKLIRMFLVSMTRDVPLPQYQHTFDKRQQDIETGRRLTMRYNCTQCHTMEDRGGYVLAHYEQEPALGPPPLPESQGAKVQEQWFHAFLKSPTTIRPWLQVRMPTFSFTDDEIAKIQKYFLGLSKQELVLRDYATTTFDEKYLRAGRRLFESYQCLSCHFTGTIPKEKSFADLAPNLALSSTRLKPQWITDWLRDPSKLQPGTRMPTYFYDGQAPDNTVFDGNAEEQIKALTAYVWSIGKKSPATMMSSR